MQRYFVQKKKKTKGNLNPSSTTRDTQGRALKKDRTVHNRHNEETAVVLNAQQDKDDYQKRQSLIEADHQNAPEMQKKFKVCANGGEKCSSKKGNTSSKGAPG